MSQLFFFLSLWEIYYDLTIHTVSQNGKPPNILQQNVRLSLAQKTRMSQKFIGLQERSRLWLTPWISARELTKWKQVTDYRQQILPCANRKQQNPKDFNCLYQFEFREKSFQFQLW